MSAPDEETAEVVVPKGWDPEGFVAHTYRCHQCATKPLDQACPEGTRRLRRPPVNAAPQEGAATPAESLPLDAETMRTTTARLLGGRADGLQPADLLDLNLLCRGHLTLLVLEVEKAASRRSPNDDTLTASTLADIDEARRRLNLTLDGRLPHTLAHAQRLARSVDHLLDDLEKLGGGRP